MIGDIEFTYTVGRRRFTTKGHLTAVQRRPRYADDPYAQDEITVELVEDETTETWLHDDPHLVNDRHSYGGSSICACKCERCYREVAGSLLTSCKCEECACESVN